MQKFQYNLKKILKDESIPELSNLIIEELESFGEVQYTKYNDGGYQLSITSDVEIIDFEPIKLIILSHKKLNHLKAEKIKESKQLASQKINSLYPEFKQINAALGIYKDVKKKEITDYIKNIIIVVDSKEAEINSKTKQATLDKVDIDNYLEV